MTDRRDAGAGGPDAGPRLKLTRCFDAPRETVFRAWTDPEWMMRWFGPRDATCPHAETDLRVGGRIRLCIRSPDGKDHWATGEYREVDPPARLVFTWKWEFENAPPEQMLIELDFVESEGGTELTLTQTRFGTDESREAHERGWRSAFDALAEFLHRLD